MKRLLLLVASLLLAACAPWQSPLPVTPVSYRSSREQLPRTVGKLRRLVVLQLRIVPKNCAGGSDGLGHAVALEPGARELLAQRKGYELVDAEALLPPDPADLVADLLAATDTDGPPGPTLHGWLLRLREPARVDGLLVLKQEQVCLQSSPATRSLLALFSFGVSEMVGLDTTQPTEEFLDASLFETASARRVWRHVYGRLEQALIPPPLMTGAGNRVDAAREWSFNHLLEPLEPALPRLLTR